MKALATFRGKLTVVLVSIGVIVIVLGGVLFFLNQHLAAQVQSIAERRALIAEQAQAKDALLQLKKDAITAQEYSHELGVTLPNTDQLLYLGQWLQDAGRPYSVEVNFSLSANTAPSAGTPGNVTFRLTARGVYKNVSQFLNDVETNHDRFVIALDNFDFAQVGLGEVQISSNGRAFYQ